MNDFILSGGTVWYKRCFTKNDIRVTDGLITEIGEDLRSRNPDVPEISADGKFVFPGFIDVHVHFREPGFSNKETIATGSAAAAHGGYTHVCTMPNLNPVPDSVPHLREQLDLIEKNAKIHVYPFASITVGEKGEVLSDMNGMADLCIGFSDDGKGVQDREMMRQAMTTAAGLHKILSAHCEENSLLCGGYIHDGEYAALHGHRGICSESEWRPVERDLQLAAETKCAYHVCHVSTKESVALIRKAKAEGIDVTCETGPHYLTLCDMDIQEDNGRFKMNPPLRSSDDREALIAGILDGTVDMIATDHAPHTAEEKSRGLQGSLMGVTGLETAFAVLYTRLVKTGRVPLERVMALLHDNPMKRFHIGTDLAVGNNADFCVFDLDVQREIRAEDFLSKGKSSPFLGDEVFGECLMTYTNGGFAWKKY